MSTSQKIKIKTSDTDGQEISLQDFLLFVRGGYKVVLIAAAIGVCVSIIYASSAKRVYEATAQFKISQIAIGYQIAVVDKKIIPLASNIEEPDQLLDRLLLPSTYSEYELKACGVYGKEHSREKLVSNLKFFPKKGGTNNFIELKTYASSPELASECAAAVFELVKKSQAEIIEPYIEEAKTKLSQDQRELLSVKEFLARQEKSGSELTATYFLAKDDIKNLTESINRINSILSSTQSFSARLLAPIYANSQPVSPKTRTALMAGIFGGILFGVLFHLTMTLLRSCKKEDVENF